MYSSKSSCVCDIIQINMCLKYIVIPELTDIKYRNECTVQLVGLGKICAPKRLCQTYKRTISPMEEIPP